MSKKSYPNLLQFEELPLEPFNNESGTQRASCQDDRIDSQRSYMVQIGGGLYFGQFSKQWYGWNFNDWGCSGYQLDMIERLWVMK